MNIQETIKHLLNKTIENGCTEDEMNSALLKAKELMDKHNLSKSDLLDKNITFILNFHDKNKTPYYYILTVLSKYSKVEILLSKSPDKEILIIIRGNEDNVRIASYLAKLIYYLLITKTNEFKKTNNYFYSDSKKTTSTLFQKGIICKITDKMIEIGNLQNLKSKQIEIHDINIFNLGQQEGDKLNITGPITQQPATQQLTKGI